MIEPSRPDVLAATLPVGATQVPSTAPRSSWQAFDLLLEGMPDGIVIADPAGLIAHANRLAEELTGYRREELLGQSVEMLVPERFRAMHSQHRSDYAASPHARPMGSALDISVRRKDGTEFPADIALSPLATEDGLLVVAAIRDATARKQAEDRLRASHALLQAVVEGTTDAVFVKDLQGRFLMVNSAGAQFMGVNVHDVVGKTATQFFAPESARLVEEVEGRIMRSGETQTQEETLTAAGITRTYLTTRGPYRSSADTVQGLIGIARDVTERIRVESRMRAISEVTEVILEGRGSQEVLRLIAHRARELVGAATAMVVVPEPGEVDLVIRVAVGHQAGSLGMRLPIDGTLAGQVFKTKRPVNTADIQADERVYQPPLAGDLGPGLFVPMVARDRSIGTIIVGNRREERPFTDDDLAVVDLFACQAAMVVEYGRTVTERARAQQSLEAVMEVTRAIAGGAASEDAVLDLVVRQARKLVGAAVGTVVMPEPGGDALVLRAADGHRREHLVGIRLSPESSVEAEVIRSGRPLRIADLAADERTNWGEAAAELGPLLCVPLPVRRRPVGAVGLANRRGGSAFTDEDLRVAELFAVQAGASLEYARIREGLQRLATATLAVKRPLDETLKALAQTVVEAADPVACAVFLLLDSGHLRTAGTYGLPTGFGAAMDAADRAGAHRPPQEAIESRATVVLENAINRMLSDPRFEPAHQVLRTVSWDTVVSLPLVHQGDVVGALSGYYPKGYRVSDTEVAFLKVVADQAASTVQSARLVAMAQENAAVEERQRLARELHDSVSQALYGIALGVQTARDLLPSAPGRVAEPLEYVRKLAEAGLAEMRALIFELRPESLQKEGLVAALAKQVAAVEARHGLKVEVDFPTEPVAALEVKEALFRIAQEALHNVAKHARANRAQLRLESRAATLVLEIADDGVGFDASQDFPGHLGLHSMRERALKLGGSLEVFASVDEGTRIRATLPLEPSPDPR